jgi:hypothetical protein
MFLGCLALLPNEFGFMGTIALSLWYAWHYFPMNLDSWELLRYIFGMLGTIAQ